MPEQIRPLKFTRSYTQNALGSVLVEAGGTKILCTVTSTDHVPAWRHSQGAGWLTAEYSMLPGSTHNRKQRDGRNNRVDARSLEIQRLIGRSLRSIIDLKSIPEVTLWVDCDVLAADGGTRTAAINGACVALYDALLYMEEKKEIRKWPLTGMVTSYDLLGAGVVQSPRDVRGRCSQLAPMPLYRAETVSDAWVQTRRAAASERLRWATTFIPHSLGNLWRSSSKLVLQSAHV